MLNRYLVFCYNTHYPGGGWNDFDGSYNTLEEAKTMARSSSYDRYHIVDSHTQQIVSIKF